MSDTVLGRRDALMGKVNTGSALMGQEIKLLHVEMCYVGTNEQRQEQHRGPRQVVRGGFLEEVTNNAI